MRATEKTTMEYLLKELKIYDLEDVEVTNKLSGRSVMLTPQEVAVYDYMTGLIDLNFFGHQEKYIQEYEACKMWILEQNSQAYSTLID